MELCFRGNSHATTGDGWQEGWGQGNRLEKVMETCAVWSGWEGCGGNKE